MVSGGARVYGGGGAGTVHAGTDDRRKMDASAIRRARTIRRDATVAPGAVATDFCLCLRGIRPGKLEVGAFGGPSEWIMRAANAPQ